MVKNDFTQAEPPLVTFSDKHPYSKPPLLPAQTEAQTRQISKTTGEKKGRYRPF
jgi:hypothetical protein